MLLKPAGNSNDADWPGNDCAEFTCKMGCSLAEPLPGECGLRFHDPLIPRMIDPFLLDAGFGQVSVPEHKGWP